MNFFLNPALACDYYKIGHLFMQPPKMKMVYSTWTARSYRHHPDCPKTVVFGYQYTLAKLVQFFSDNFFSVDLEELKYWFNEAISCSFNPRYADFSKFEALWHHGHLPISVYGVPEGTLLPAGIPDHVIFNTNERFAWLPQFLEDLWSSMNWLPSTSATTAYYRKKLIQPYAEKTSDVFNLASHMCGDFSLRGHTSLEAGLISGAGHLLSFDRTATIGSNVLLSWYYDAPLTVKRVSALGAEGGPPGMGAPSLEHSVVEQGIAWFKHRLAAGDLPEYMRPYVTKVIMDGTWELNLIAEMCFILYLIKEVQPTGLMTYVSDTYDYWGVVTKILPVIKDAILERYGCFSVRPDSGDPVQIICGDKEHNVLGTLEWLEKIFGTSLNTKGYKVLPPQIRMIYGDAITTEITTKVCDWCEDNHFSIENLSFGIGAYTYQYVTRDTRGYAIKATDCIHEDFGEMPIFKAPKTSPEKRSPRGCVAVLRDSKGNYTMRDGLTLEASLKYTGNIMVCKMEDGQIKHHETFETIRRRLELEEK